jgi:hypothetical protein
VCKQDAQGFVPFDWGSDQVIVSKGSCAKSNSQAVSPLSREEIASDRKNTGPRNDNSVAGVSPKDKFALRRRLPPNPFIRSILQSALNKTTDLIQGLGGFGEERSEQRIAVDHALPNPERDSHPGGLGFSGKAG